MVGPSDRIHAFDAGAHGTLSRPFNRRELLAELTLLLQLGNGGVSGDVGAGPDTAELSCACLRFRLIFGHSPDAALLTDRGGGDHGDQRVYSLRQPGI